MESVRYGRTRYLVVVSCSRTPAQRKSQQQHFNNLINAQNISNSKSISSSNSSLNRSGSTENQNSHSSGTPSPNRKSASLEQTTPNSTAAILTTTLKTSTKHLINEKDLSNLNRLSTSPKQDEKLQQPPQIDLSDDMNPNNMNEVEESCLLGIDCNEKTTVGLVLRLLGDTTIRLDGDG